MRVDLTTFGVDPPESTKNSRPAGASNTSNSTSSSSTSESASSGISSGGSNLDNANFSFDPARLQSLAAQVLAQPEIRGTRVQALQQAIGDGEYSIPPNQVADALASELSGAQG